MDYLIETDPEIRAALITEQQRLNEFLNSDGYKAGKAVIDKSYADAITFILDANPTTPGYDAQINQAIGEARGARDFVQLFTKRFDEIAQALGPLTDEEKP